MTTSLRSISSSTCPLIRASSRSPSRAARGRPARPRARAGGGASPPGSSTPRRSRATCARCAWACSCAVRAAAIAGAASFALPSRAARSLASACEKRSGSTALTSTASNPGRPSSSRRRRSRSIVSFTGISSARATPTIAVCSGSRMKASMRSAWRRTGPTRAMSPNVRGARSSAIPWPVAGASTMTRSYGVSVGFSRSSWASSQIVPDGDELGQTRGRPRSDMRTCGWS